MIATKTERSKIVDYLRRMAGAYSRDARTPGSIPAMAAQAHAADVLRDMADKIERCEHVSEPQ